MKSPLTVSEGFLPSTVVLEKPVLVVTLEDKEERRDLRLDRKARSVVIMVSLLEQLWER